MLISTDEFPYLSGDCIFMQYESSSVACLKSTSVLKIRVGKMVRTDVIVIVFVFDDPRPMFPDESKPFLLNGTSRRQIVERTFPCFRSFSTNYTNT